MFDPCMMIYAVLLPIYLYNTSAFNDLMLYQSLSQSTCLPTSHLLYLLSTTSKATFPSSIRSSTSPIHSHSPSLPALY